MTSKPVQATDFFVLWVNTCLQQRTLLFRDWNNRPVFTGHVFKGPTSITATIANCLGLRSHSEYYKIDEVFFATGDLVPNIPQDQIWIRRIRIAFEHEHDFNSGLFQEVSHLLITDCDLRVLVSYPNNEEELKFQLEYLHTVIAGSDRSCQISEAASLLFIVGWRDAVNGTIDWWGYVYKCEDWQKIQ